ncbi:PREDICTED: uncharacterized protein LOC105621016 [Atta cephalotes]|uniref:Attacin C-terminal domain-containing protein n=1 Tax=Atta cephalotes TaxID=12957 RepID=A0A158NK24_ATTCE|nr:PREDICTED: uncharacterized protein LOC105621016 [Atta cephalotes]
MKLLVFVLAVLCAVTYTSADLSGKTSSVLSSHELRFPRQTNLPNLQIEEPKKGSITFQGTQPLSGSQRQPTWNLNANANVFNKDHTTADVYGGLSKVPGQRVQPHFGIQAEKNFGKNGFIRSHTEFQQGPQGHRFSPSVGIIGGFRFKREAEPQGSISFQGTQPLSGPMRQPTWDLNVNRNIVNNGRTTADVYGGLRTCSHSARGHCNNRQIQGKAGEMQPPLSNSWALNLSVILPGESLLSLPFPDHEWSETTKICRSCFHPLVTLRGIRLE